MISPVGEQIADVGLAKFMQKDFFTNVSAIGTLAWAAPELLVCVLLVFIAVLASVLGSADHGAPICSFCYSKLQ